MEVTLKNAIAKAKREALKGTDMDCIIENTTYDYYLREDEKQQLIKSVNKFLERIYKDCEDELKK